MITGGPPYQPLLQSGISRLWRLSRATEASYEWTNQRFQSREREIIYIVSDSRARRDHRGSRGGEVLFDGSSHRRDQTSGLRTERQIDLFRKREAAKREQAQRKEAEACVRHLNLDFVIRIVLLVIAILIGISVIVGALGNPIALELSLVAASAWAAIAAGVIRVLRPKPREGLD